MNRIDPFTKEEFKVKRMNQLFASAKNRIDYHNKAAAGLRHAKSPIDKSLHKNYLILCKLVDAGKTVTIDKEQLLLKGFNPAYFTHLTLHENKTNRCLYHFILPPSENSNTITIIYPDYDRPI